jgi:hypothetical protein
MGFKLTSFICLLLLFFFCVQPVLAEDTSEDESTDEESTSNISSGLDKGLTLDLLNQDPDPVKPGDVLEIRLSIQNTGYDDLENCVLEIKPEYPFKAISGETLVKNIGTLGKRYEDNRQKVVKFKLGVENSVNEGKYPLKVYVYTTKDRSRVSRSSEFDIEIDSESNAEIEYINVEKMVPGQKTNLIFGIKNVGNSPLKNAMFSWDCANDVILPVGSSNVKHINLIDIGDTENVSFQVLTNVNTKPGLYKLDMVLTYDDVEELKTITEAGTVENQKRKEIKSKAGVYVGGTTDFDIAFMERSPTGDYTFTVSNIGNNAANSVKVSVPLQTNWTVAGGSSNSVVLGNLQKGDNAIADFNLKPAAMDKELPIKFEISYTSNDGIRQTVEREIPLYSSSFTPLAESDESKGGNSSSLKYIGLAILACVAGAVLYKRRQKKMKMKNAQQEELNEIKFDDPDK